MLKNFADVLLGPSVGSLLMFLIAALLVIGLIVGVVILILWMLRKSK